MSVLYLITQYIPNFSCTSTSSIKKRYIKCGSILFYIHYCWRLYNNRLVFVQFKTIFPISYNSGMSIIYNIVIILSILNPVINSFLKLCNIRRCRKPCIIYNNWRCYRWWCYWTSRCYWWCSRGWIYDWRIDWCVISYIGFSAPATATRWAA